MNYQNVCKLAKTVHRRRLIVSKHFRGEKAENKLSKYPFQEAKRNPPKPPKQQQQQQE